MSDRPEIDLKPGDEYRRTFSGPLEKRTTLAIGLVFFGTFALAGAWAAYELGTFWAAFIPIPCAVGFGIFAVGMWPNWFFGRDKS
jgi:hypothetical protein